MTAVVVPASLADRLEPLLGVRVRTAASAVGGHSNLVFHTRTESGEAVVVKAAASAWKRADVVRESTVLRSIAAGAVPVPQVVAAFDDDEWAVLVTTRVDGRLGLSLLADVHADNDLAVSVGKLMGRLLRLVHRTAPVPAGDPTMDRASSVELLADPLRFSGAPVEVVDALLPALDHPVHRGGTSLVHGDFGLHNVLFGESSDMLTARCLLDWELSGTGNALSDVAWVWWTFALRELPRPAFDAFATAYGVDAIEGLGWSAEAVDALIRAQMAALLVRTDQGTEVRDTWVQRARALGSLPPLHRAG